MTNPYLALEGVSYVLPDGRTLFSELNEQFDQRPTGLVGRNGIGKTVLARMLAGQVQPTAGRCVRSGSVQPTGHPPRFFLVECSAKIMKHFGSAVGASEVLSAHCARWQVKYLRGRRGATTGAIAGGVSGLYVPVGDNCQSSGRARPYVHRASCCNAGSSAFLFQP